MDNPMHIETNRRETRDQPIEYDLPLLDQLPGDRAALIIKIAADLDMEPAEVLAWAVDLLTRYVAAGGEP